LQVDIKIETAGHRAPYLVCHGVDATCGNIRNGLGLCFENRDGTNEGSWVICFEDLEKLYWTTKFLREKQ